MNNALLSEPRLRLYALAGLAASAISLAVMHAGYVFGSNRVQNLDSYFLISYGLAVVYLFASVAFNVHTHGVARFWRFDPVTFRLTTILFAIAAFSLNRNMQVLGDTPFWLVAYLYLAFLGLFLDNFSERLHPAWNTINSFLAGMGVIITIYFSLMVAFLVPISIVGLIFFGISSVAFTPYFALAGFLGVARRGAGKAHWYSLSAGILLPVMFLLAFMGQYGVVRRDMVKVLDEYSESRSDLPREVFAAQYLPQRALSRQLMQVRDKRRLWDMGFDFFTSNGGNARYNDPLTVLGHGLSREMPLNMLQRMEIIASQTDLRHEAQRRLWEDDHVLTRHVDTEIEIYPEYRLAYTEKTFEVEHYGKEINTGRWREEAVYTFHLPEGSVATSLSLWVDGKERKARFSSKKQADEAYATIVGRESRDPALLHWQEGNTLTVTVFPVMPELPRRFKIGITSPLRMKDGKLSLESIYFEGPTHQYAREKGHLRILGDQAPGSIELPGHFEQQNTKEWAWEGSYEPWWQMSLAAGPVSDLPFAFNGHTYQAFPWKPGLEPRDFKRIYLDLNSSWTDEEFAAVWAQVKDKKVLTFDRGMKVISEANRKAVLESAREAHFSLFPFYEVNDPASALVISKSAPNYIEKQDLEHSTYGRAMHQFLQNHQEPVAFFNIGAATGPYLRTLREFRALNYVSGGTELLGRWLKEGRYLAPLDDPGAVVLPDAGMVIVQSDAEPGTAAGQAPDHLLRLWAYNKSLEEAGRNYLLDEGFSREALRVAEEGYVVSPFTSLVVLETDADYERFGIEESENSLGNAGLHGMAGKGTGSVPEPHEWLLIGLVLLLLIYTQRRRLRLA